MKKSLFGSSAPQRLPRGGRTKWQTGKSGYPFALFVIMSLLFFNLQLKAQVIDEGFEEGAWQVASSASGQIVLTAPSTSSTVTYYAGYQQSTGTNIATSINTNGNSGTWLYSKASAANSTYTRLSKNRSFENWFGLSSGGYIATPVINEGVATVTFWVNVVGNFAVGINTDTNGPQQPGHSSNAANTIPAQYSYASQLFQSTSLTTKTVVTNATGGTAAVGNSMQQVTFTGTFTGPCRIGIFNLVSSGMAIDDIVITAPIVGPPSTQASNINFTGTGSTTMTANWTRGNGGNVAVFMKAGAGAITNPSDGSTYTASSDWDVKGTQLGASGYYCVYNGPGTSVTVTNLVPTTLYTFQAFEYSGTGGGTFYNVNTATGNPNSNTTLSPSVPTVTTTAVSLIATSTATSGGNVTSDGGATVTQRGIVYSTSPNPTTANTKVIDGSGGEGSYVSNMSGLASATLYYVRAYAINSQGTSYGNEVSFSTSASYRSKATGDWNAPSTWEVFNGSSWVDATGTPSSSDDVITVRNGHIVTITASVTVDETSIDAGGQVIINSGQTLTVANGAGQDLTVNGYLKNSGTLTLTGTAEVNGATAVYEHNINTLTIPAFTWSSGSTLKLTGSYVTALTLPSQGYQNVWFEGSIATGYMNMGGQTIAGKLTVASTAPGELIGTTSGTAFTAAALDVTGGTYMVNRGGSGTRATVIIGNVNVSGGTLDIKQGTSSQLGQLTIGGDLTISGSGIVTKTGSGTASLIFNGTSQTITNNGTFDGAVNTFIGTTSPASAPAVTLATDLTFVSGASLMITDGSLTVASGKSLRIQGTADFNGKAVTFKSDASGTARLGNVTGTLTNATNVTVERYIPANGRRAWRLLGANVEAASAPTIYNAWQEGGAAGSTGTHITQAGGAGTNGFDASSIASSSSIRYYDGAGLQAPANTNATKITDNGGAYFLFVRGDRNIDLNNGSASSNTKLRHTGTLNQGTVVTTANTGAFTLIPNPYPSPVDYEIIATTAPNDVNLPTGQYYIWDANMGSVGAYRTIQRTGVGTYSSTPTTGDDNTIRYIRSGQAFFIPVASQVTFTEAMKTAMLPSTNVYRPGAGTEELTIDLKVLNAGGNAVLYDGVRAKYNNSYAAVVDQYDAPKLNNFNENLAIARDNKLLSVEQRPLVDAADTIFLKLWNTGIKNYRFVINPANFSSTANLDAYLIDGYLNTTTPVSLSASTTFDFSITSNTSSANADRFMIVFRPATSLPVNFTNVKAYQKEAGIQVEWNVGAEQDVIKYELENR